MGEYKLGMECEFWYEKTPHDLHYNLSEEMIENYCERNGPTARRGGI